MRTFNKWLDTFIEEKEIDLEDTFTVVTESGTPNIIPYGVIIEHIKITAPEEQKKIKDILVQLDFENRDIRYFFKHLGQAIAKD